jgi:hypothetical protein
MNITYLLGAGASANTIPIVKHMNQRISDIVYYLEKISTVKYDHLDISGYYSEIRGSLVAEKDVILDVIEDFNWLLSEAENYYSIDTLAKKYYLINNSEDYERLKKCLIIYFMIEQYVVIPDKNLYEEENLVISKDNQVQRGFTKQSIDKRYDSFFSSLAKPVDSGLEINKNVKIISWNYDIQIELSLMRFCGKDIDLIKNRYNIHPLLNKLDYNQNDTNSMDSFMVRKLNGNAIFNFSETNYNKHLTVFDYQTPDKCSHEQKLRTIFKTFKELDHKQNIACRFLNFAWECDEYFIKKFNARGRESFSSIIEEAEEISQKTEILVVIGYSFPISNRDIDSRILNNMGELKKVYVQDKYPQKIESTMRNAFSVLQRREYVDGLERKEKYKVDFHLDDNIDQFTIPYEMHK